MLRNPEYNIVAFSHYSHCCYHSFPRRAFAHAAEGHHKARAERVLQLFLSACLCHTAHSAQVIIHLHQFQPFNGFVFLQAVVFIACAKAWQAAKLSVSTFDSQLPPWKHQLRGREDGLCQARMSHPWEVTQGTGLVLNNGHN